VVVAFHLWVTCSCRDAEVGCVLEDVGSGSWDVGREMHQVHAKHARGKRVAQEGKWLMLVGSCRDAEVDCGLPYHIPNASGGAFTCADQAAPQAVPNALRPPEASPEAPP
jgi:hypothetical protein